MKHIEIDDDLYAFIASQTKYIGEDASQILRRLLLGDSEATPPAPKSDNTVHNSANDGETSVMATPQAETVAETEQCTTASIDAPATDMAALLQGAKASGDSRVEQFLHILASLHHAHAEQFEKVLTVKGRDRLYFAKSKDTLLKSGSSTNPKQVPGTEYWVVTNNNTAKKTAMIAQVADVLGYSAPQIDTLKAGFAA